MTDTADKITLEPRWVPDGCPSCQCTTFADIDGGGVRCVHCKRAFRMARPPISSPVAGELAERAYNLLYPSLGWDGLSQVGKDQWEVVTTAFLEALATHQGQRAAALDEAAKYIEDVANSDGEPDHLHIRKTLLLPLAQAIRALSKETEG